jgi:hypothetical protein
LAGSFAREGAGMASVVDLVISTSVARKPTRLPGSLLG